ncbi:MAG: ABC transporter permease [Bacteroidia bacterium]|nr:MAG: ABC transporter permease [Bacteroidia bacterium]
MQVLRKNWWKFLGILLILWVIIGGFLFEVPDLPVIRQSIRNIYFHVGMWFGMIFILFAGVVFSIRYLLTNNPEDDIKAFAAVRTGLLFGALGLLTGMFWAKFTWGAFWVNDPKLNGAAVGMLTYLAYIVLRSSVEDQDKRARLAAVYNVFAFVLFFVFIMILPRTASASIHPGVDGNPALATGDLAPGMRIVFYPAIAGWFIMAWWLFTILFRTEKLAARINDLTENKNIHHG